MYIATRHNNIVTTYIATRHYNIVSMYILGTII